MTSIRFVFLTIFFALAVFCIGPTINFIIDPYSVFGTKFFPEYGQLQERFLKIEFLKTHKDFDTFLISSSRIGTIKTDYVERYFTNSKSYNFTISQANQWDVEKHIEWLVNNQPNLRHVIVQVDWFFGYGSDRPAYALLDEIHPDISGRERYDFLLDYLMYFNIEGLKAKVKNNFGSQDLLDYNLTKGYWSRPIRDKKIENNCQEYVKNEKAFTSDKLRKLGETTIDNSLAAIKRYKKLLDSKNIELTIIMTPQNHFSLDGIDFQEYEYVLKYLAKITNFYNFMYYNKITNNNCNYYENSHYRPHIGEVVIKQIADKSKLNSDIFRLISKSNSDAQIDFLKNNFLNARAVK